MKHEPKWEEELRNILFDRSVVINIDHSEGDITFEVFASATRHFGKWEGKKSLIETIRGYIAHRDELLKVYIDKSTIWKTRTKTYVIPENVMEEIEAKVRSQIEKDIVAMSEKPPINDLTSIVFAMNPNVSPPDQIKHQDEKFFIKRIAWDSREKALAEVLNKAVLRNGKEPQEYNTIHE